MMQHKECRSCEYWDKYLFMCSYAEKEGRTRLSLHGGNWRRLMVKCEEYKPGKKVRREAWRELPAIPAKSRRRK